MKVMSFAIIVGAALILCMIFVPKKSTLDAVAKREKKANETSELTQKKLEEQKKAEEKAKIEGIQLEIGWGSQIRSYVFHPYSMVKDHRSNFETANVQGVMDGDLDGFINAYLQWKLKEDNPK